MFRIIYKLYQKKKSIVSYNIIKYCVDCVGKCVREILPNDIFFIKKFHDSIPQVRRKGSHLDTIDYHTLIIMENIGQSGNRHIMYLYNYK